MKYCQNCGNPLESDTDFCPNCGVPIKNTNKNNNTKNKASSSNRPNQFNSPNFVSSFKDFWLNYSNFNGRMSRASFWISYLEIFAINVLICLLIFIDPSAQGILGLIYTIYNIILILPIISATCRRLHDVNRSGWFQLLSLIPFVGIIILIVILCMPSTNVNNRFGVPDTNFLENN